MIYALKVAFVATLITITIFDIKKRVIPNSLVLIVGILAVMATVFQRDTTLLDRFIGMLCVSLPLLIISLIISNAFGGGDIKLMAAAGFYLGYQLTLLSFIIALYSAGAYGVWLLIAKKKGKRENFAFGPFLCGGMIVGVLLGEEILKWYAG